MSKKKPKSSIKTSKTEHVKKSASMKTAAPKKVRARVSDLKEHKSHGKNTHGKNTKDSKDKTAKKLSKTKAVIPVNGLKRPVEATPPLASSSPPPAKVSAKSTPVTPTSVPGFVAETFQTSAADTDVVLTDAEGRRYCKVKDCDQLANVETYCRFHYLLLWKRIQVRRKILLDGKLERFVEDLTARYPDKFLEMIRKDLRSEKDFQGAMAELELDESGMDNDYDNGETESEFIDEVRSAGNSESSGLVDDSDY